MTTKLTPAATTAPAAPAAAKPTDAPAAAKPAEAKPAVTAGKPEAKLGAQLIGKIEGAVIQPEAKRPAKLGEAPMLADLVKAGKLPPVEQRIPEEPMVVKPLRETGKYGGMWRRAFTGPADGENFNRVMGHEKPIHVDYTGFKVVPAVAKSWQLKDGGKTISLSLRKGMKWSDGTPFTADNWMFWWDEIYSNKEIVPVGTPEMTINGKPGKMVKVDDLTVEFQFPEPYPMFVDVLSAFTQMGSGLALGGTQWSFMGPYVPGHYLKQFLPKFTPDVDAKAKAGGFDGWIAQLKAKYNYALNPELPVMSAWRTVTPINTPVWTLERNPFFWGVDTDGNQLPYIDKIQLTLAENLEVANLRGIAGEFDEMGRHMDVAKLPVFLENQQKGNYKVVLDLQSDAAAVAIHINQSFEADPEIRKWLTNVDFRRALSLGIDRDQFNEAWFLGMAVPSSLMSDDASPENAGPEWRTKWSTLDVKQANDLLDKIGLTKKDAEGYRQRLDGKGKLSLDLTTLGGQFVQFTRISEMVREQYKKIGIDLLINERERTLAIRRGNGNETQMIAWSNDGTDTLYANSGWIIPVDGNSWWSPEYGKWFQSGGSAGKEPPPAMKKCMELTKAAYGQDEKQRIETGKEIWRTHLEDGWYIGGVGQAGAVMGIMIAKNNVGNTPSAYANINLTWPPSIARPVQFYFKS